MTFPLMPYVITSLGKSAVMTEADRSTSTASTYTFTAKSMGSASATRRIAVMVSAYNSSTRNISSVTIAGVAATLTSVIPAGSYPSVVAVVDLPTGTTGNVVVTISGGNASWCGIAVFALYDFDSGTPDDYQYDRDFITGPFTPPSLSVSANGVALGYCQSGTTGTDHVWTECTEIEDNTTGRRNSCALFNNIGSGATSISESVSAGGGGGAFVVSFS